MKKIELLAERAKIAEQIIKAQYYTIQIKPMGSVSDPVMVTNITEAELREAYETSEKLLKKLDAINNALFEADAREYIDVMGNRLSVATARKYLNEFEEDGCLDSSFRDEICRIGEAEEVKKGENLRATVYCHCIIHELDIVDKDPLNLKERRNEFCKKMADWYYAVKTAVAVSDATTEVEMIY